MEESISSRHEEQTNETTKKKGDWDGGIVKEGLSGFLGWIDGVAMRHGESRLWERVKVRM